MAGAKTSNERQTKHVKFTNNLQFLGIPQTLIEKAIKELIGDEKFPIWFTVKILKNNGTRILLIPTKIPKPNERPFKGWKSNNESRRYYISATTLRKALKCPRNMLGQISLPSTVQGGTIIATLPALLRQAQ